MTDATHNIPTHRPGNAPAICLILAVGLSTCAGPAQRRTFEIVAHKGASSLAPENTLSAVRLAWELDADAVEVDVRQTADGQIVLCHDGDLQRTANADVKIHERTLDELRRFDIGSWRGEQWSDERMPTLVQVIGTIPDDRRLFVEIKTGPGILDAFERVLHETRVDPRKIAVISFNHDVIAAVKARLPHLKAYWLTWIEYDAEKQQWSPSIDGIIAVARQTAADGVGLQAAGCVDRAYVDQIKAAGLEIHTWTVNDPARARQLLDAGVQSITTDVPGELRRHIHGEPRDPSPTPR